MPIQRDVCVVWTGDDMPDLGIKEGDSLNTVLVAIGNYISGAQELSTKVDSLEAQVSDFSSGNIMADTSLFTGTASVASANILSRAFTYSVEKSGTDYIVSYDLTDVRKNLPSDYTLLKVESSLVDAESNKYSSKGAVSTLKATSIPSTFDVTATVRTPTGDIELVKQLAITQAVSDKGATLGIRDFTTSPDDVTQKEVNSIFSQSLTRLESDLEEADVVKLKGDAAIQSSAISDNTTQITVVSDESDKQISELTAVVDALKLELNTLKQRTTQLEAT